MFSRNPKWCAWLSALVVTGTSPVAGSAGKASGNNRTQVFVVGLSDDLAHKAGLVTQQLRKVMRSNPKFEVVDLADKMQPPPPEKTKEFLGEARRELKAAKTSLQEMEYVAAVRHAALARQAFEKMGGYLAPLQRYKESILLLAVGESMQGNVEKAKGAFLDLILLDPHVRLAKGAYEGFVLDLFNQVKREFSQKPSGSLSIKTDPPGGNLYLNGKLKGLTPDSIDGVTAGNHLVVVKTPGFQNWGKVVRVEAGDLVSLDVKLVPGKAGSGFVEVVRRAGQAVSDSELRGEVLRLGQTLGLDWVWLCQLRHDSYELVLHSFLFEFSKARIIHEDKLKVEGAGYGMEEDMRRFGERFLRTGWQNLRRFREEGDPLDSRSGTEDWYRDESEKSREHREDHATKKKDDDTEKSGDPLDDIDGTEDW